MRLTTDTPELLVIDHVSWGTALAAPGFVLVTAVFATTMILGRAWAGGLALLVFGGGAGLAVLAGVTERCQLTLDRQSGQAVLRRRTARGPSECRLPLARLRRAGVQIRRGRGGVTHRLVLSRREGPGLPVMQTHSGGPAAARLAEAINGRLAAA